MSIGDNIKRERQKIRMKQTELAEKLETNITTISRWENNKNLPNAETIAKIANIFQVPVSELYDLSQTQEIHTNTTNTKNFQKILNILEESNNDDSLYANIGTRTMTFRNGKKELTIPYDRELSLQILKEIFSDMNVTNNNGILVNGTRNSGSQFNFNDKGEINHGTNL